MAAATDVKHSNGDIFAYVKSEIPNDVRNNSLSKLLYEDSDSTTRLPSLINDLNYDALQASNSLIKKKSTELITPRESVFISIQYIKCKIEFDNFLKKLREDLPNFNKSQAEYKFFRSYDNLSKLWPDKLTLEVSEDNSLYYSFIKKDYTVYFTYNLNKLGDEEDEAFVSIFKLKTQLPSYSGSYSDAYLYLESNIKKQHKFDVEQTTKPLSFQNSSK